LQHKFEIIVLIPYLVGSSQSKVSFLQLEVTIEVKKRVSSLMFLLSMQSAREVCGDWIAHANFIGCCPTGEYITSVV